MNRPPLSRERRIRNVPFRLVVQSVLGAILYVAVAPDVARAQQTIASADSTRSRYPTQRDVARMIVSRDATTRADGLRMARMVQPQYVSQALRLGLFAALDVEAATYRANQRTGGGDDLGTEFHRDVLAAVIALHDSLSIPALANSLGTLAPVASALAAFGPTAAAATLRVSAAPTSDHAQVADGLLVLWLMVEGAPARPVSPPVRARIRAAAASRLSGTQSFDVLVRAIDLAVALGDPSLRRTVETIASNPAEAGRRGVHDPALAARLQQHARERLAGLPPAPGR